MATFSLLFLLCLCLIKGQLFESDNSKLVDQENVQKSEADPKQQQVSDNSGNVNINGNDKVIIMNDNIDDNEVEQVLLGEDNANIETVNNANNANNANNEQLPITTTRTTKTRSKTTIRIKKKSSSYVWVSVVDTNITSVIGARVLSQSLSKHNSNADRIIICFPGVTDKEMNMLKDFGWKIHLISVNMYDKIKNYPHNVQLELIKILMFNFTEYSSVGYLSPQSMVTTNIDHLFECGLNALCGTPNDRHHQIYHNNQRHTKKLLDDNDNNNDDNVEYILYDENGHIRNQKNNDNDNENENENDNIIYFGRHQSVFDDNIFLMAPEHDLYIDIFTFITSSHDEMEGIQHLGERRDLFPSYLSEYFYHYCKGNGYPISKQEGTYIPPKVIFNCSDDDKECKMNLAISKSPCYVLEEGYNFHPSHNDHISSSWHWKQSMKHLSIKIIQYSSYNTMNIGAAITNINHNNDNDYKPWNWRYVIFSGWMIEWNIYASVEPNLYFEFLLNNNQSNDELIYSLWQTPLLYFIFIVILLITMTALSTPCFNLFGFIINKLSKTSPSFINIILNIYKWSILPILLIWTIMIIINPIKQIFINQEIIPSSYPFKKGWILGLQYIYFITSFKFIIICFILYWFGNLYHPIKFKLKWFDYLQLKLFAFDSRMVRKYYYFSPKITTHHDIESGGKYHDKYHGYSDSQLSNKFRWKSINNDSDNTMWFTRIILKFQNWRSHLLYNILLKYLSILMIIVLKWCLWYLFCIIIILSTIWILRWNDWHELKIIIGTEFIICLIWLTYCSINIYCQFFIYPQIKKYGDKYYDSEAFEKGK